MSSVASSKVSDASDAASTTGSANSGDSGASSVASATSGASKASTAPSSVKSENSGTGSADDKSSQELKEWYNKQINVAANKPKFNGWLRASRNSDPTTATVMGPLTTVDDFFDSDKRESGVYQTEKGTNVIRFAPQGEPSGQQSIRIGDDVFTCTWVPAAPGAGSSLHYVGATESPTMGTATETGKTMPSLAPCLRLAQPTIPPETEAIKSFDPKTAKMGPIVDIGGWIGEYGTVERYKGAQFGQDPCYEFDRWDRVVMAALKKAKIDAETADNFVLIDKSSRCLSQSPKVPSAMASSVLNNVYKKKIPKVKWDPFRKAVEEECTRELSHPQLPVTDDGLCTFRWASSLMDGDEIKGVDETTANGRQMTMRKVRAEIYNATEASYHAATAAATRVTDWLHINRDHDKCTGVRLQDLLDHAIDALKKGGKLPKNCPQSLLDNAKARDEMNETTRNSLPRSKTPFGLDALPASSLPTKVPAHQAQTSGPNTFQSGTKTATKPSLSDDLRSRIARLPNMLPKGGVKKFNDFFGNFPRRGV